MPDHRPSDEQPHYTRNPGEGGRGRDGLAEHREHRTDHDPEAEGLTDGDHRMVRTAEASPSSETSTRVTGRP